MDAESRKPIVVVAGPTGSGKSALALELARAFRGAIVNADSQQVYRELLTLMLEEKDNIKQATKLLFLSRCCCNRLSADIIYELSIDVPVGLSKI